MISAATGSSIAGSRRRSNCNADVWMRSGPVLVVGSVRELFCSAAEDAVCITIESRYISTVRNHICCSRVRTRCQTSGIESVVQWECWRMRMRFTIQYLLCCCRVTDRFRQQKKECSGGVLATDCISTISVFCLCSPCSRGDMYFLL